MPAQVRAPTEGWSALDRARLKTDFRLVQVARDAVDSSASNRVGGRELQSDRQGDRFVEQLVILKQVGEARHRLMQQAAHLDHQPRALLYQIMPVT